MVTLLAGETTTFHVTSAADVDPSCFLDPRILRTTNQLVDPIPQRQPLPGATAMSEHDATADLSAFPDGFLFGAATASYQIEGAVARGRPHAVDLGHLLAHPGEGAARRHRRRRRRPLPPGGRGRRPDEGARSPGVPLLAGVAADPARRLRSLQPARPRLLLPAGRPAPRRRCRADRHALPLGPAPGARGRRRLDVPGDVRGVRDVCGQGRRGAGRPGAHLDHPQRAVVLRLPRLLLRRPRAGPREPGRRTGGRPPPQPRATVWRCRRCEPRVRVPVRR